MFEKAEEMATVNGTPGTDEVLACVRLLSSVLVVHEVVHNLVKTKTSSSTYFTHYFKLIIFKSIAKQVIPTYINHSRPLIPDGIHLFFLNKVWAEREAGPVLICWTLSKEASGTIFITSLVWRGQGSNPRPPAHRANALTTEPPLQLFYTLGLMLPPSTCNSIQRCLV